MALCLVAWRMRIINKSRSITVINRALLVSKGFGVRLRKNRGSVVMARTVRANGIVVFGIFFVCGNFTATFIISLICCVL